MNSIFIFSIRLMFLRFSVSIIVSMEHYISCPVSFLEPPDIFCLFFAFLRKAGGYAYTSPFCFISIHYFYPCHINYFCDMASNIKSFRDFIKSVSCWQYKLLSISPVNISLFTND